MSDHSITSHEATPQRLIAVLADIARTVGWQAGGRPAYVAGCQRRDHEPRSL
jgi:hypothetical protein